MVPAHKRARERTNTCVRRYMNECTCVCNNRCVRVCVRVNLVGLGKARLLLGCLGRRHFKTRSACKLSCNVSWSHLIEEVFECVCVRKYVSAWGEIREIENRLQVSYNSNN